MNLINEKIQARESGGLVAKSICPASFRVLRFSSLHSSGDLQPYVTTVSGDLTPSPDLCKHQAHR